MEFPGVLVFDLEIYGGCNIILPNFQGWSFVFVYLEFPGVYTEKKLRKIPGFFFKKVCPDDNDRTCENDANTRSRYGQCLLLDKCLIGAIQVNYFGISKTLC